MCQQQAVLKCITISCNSLSGLLCINCSNSSCFLTPLCIKHLTFASVCFREKMRDDRYCWYSLKFFCRQTDITALGIVLGILESYLLSVEINTKKYLFIFLRFRAVFRNPGKLAYVDSRSHKGITAVCGVKRVPSFYLFLKSQVTFFNSSTLLLVMRGDYSGTLMIRYICHSVLIHNLHLRGPPQSERLQIQMSSLPSCRR